MKQYFLVILLDIKKLFKQTTKAKANNTIELNCCMKGQYIKSIAFSHINNPIRLVWIIFKATHASFIHVADMLLANILGMLDILT